ncbi:MAG: NAD-dependent epimerase/dehydratase family protein [Candidatus Bathyarchaeota archaeon]|nr:NAD-dependent epimerase/dehydratase family protein [Candidatus Bathyarchaeota archaeon]
MGHDRLKVLVTGGAGFIGSHLVERLMKGNHGVTVIDNLSNGSLRNIESWLDNEHFSFIKGDLKESQTSGKAAKDAELVFHLAANPEVRVGETDPSIHFEENLVATFRLLEALRKQGSARVIVFTSTSTVYGEALRLPTPEDYGPSIPISTYGATKLGSEALIDAYAHTFDLRGLIFRLANIVGPRGTTGVVVDFVKKLRANPKRLEILGDGSQKKSYLYIDDCIDAISFATNEFLNSNERIKVYNVGAPDSVTVARIAEIVAEEMSLSDVRFVFTGGVNGGRGWRGDVKTMLLSTERLLKQGWRPKYGSEEAVRLAAKKLVEEP